MKSIKLKSKEQLSIMILNKKYKIVTSNPYTNEVLHGRGLVIRSKWKDSYAAVIANHGIKHLFLNYSLGWECDDYSFLASMTGIKSVDIIDCHSHGIEAIEYLADIEALSLNVPDAYDIDYRKFNGLRSLFCYGRKPNESLFECRTIEELYIDEFVSADSQRIGDLRSLKRLTIANSDLSDLSFLCNLNELTHLVLTNCKSITSFKPISFLPHLNRLEIRGSRIHDVSFLGDATSLETLIIETDYMDSIDPLKNLTSLKALALIGSKMVIKDGDLTAINSLKNLSMLDIPNRRIYSHQIHNYWNWKDYGVHSQVWITPKTK